MDGGEGCGTMECKDLMPPRNTRCTEKLLQDSWGFSLALFFKWWTNVFNKKYYKKLKMIILSVKYICSPLKKKGGTSPVVEWLRIHLPRKVVTEHTWEVLKTLHKHAQSPDAVSWPGD